MGQEAAMILAMKLVGILIAGVGIFWFIRPDAMKKVLKWLQEGKRSYGIGLLRLAIALVILFAASQSRLPAVAVTLGILFLLSGITVFAIGQEKLFSLFQWWDEQTDLVLRLLALIAVTFGVLILYIA